jgi:hypothetical protein
MWTISIIQRHVWFQALTYRSLVADVADLGLDVPHTFHHGHLADEIVFCGVSEVEF